VDQPTSDRSTLVLFDFDGTLVELSTDYPLLRQELAELEDDAKAATGAGLLQRLSSLYATPDQAERVSAVVDKAELGGLQRGRALPQGVSLYAYFAGSGATIAIVTHNGRAVVEEFFASVTLSPPDAIYDLRKLGGPKQEAHVVHEYVRRTRLGRRYVVGNDDADRALASAISAEYLDVRDF